MTCKRVTTLTLVLAAALAGCGNYSNEDLEYMNAVPDRDALTANMPARRTSCPANEAELSKTTHEVVATFNGAARPVPGHRRRGPRVPADPALAEPAHLGSRARRARAGLAMAVHRHARPGRHREFHLRAAVPAHRRPAQTPGLRCSPGGSRRRRPAAHAAAWAASAFRPPSYAMRVTRSTTAVNGSTSIDVTYSTREFPISVVVDFVQFTDFTFTTTNTFHYEYGAQENGQGAMRFVITGADLIDGSDGRQPGGHDALAGLRRRPRRGDGHAGRCRRRGDSGCWAHAGRVLGY